MPDREKVIGGLAACTGETNGCAGPTCPYWDFDDSAVDWGCRIQMELDALALLKEQEKEIKALRLLVEWAEECDFGFDQFPDEYEQYKDEIEDMKYIDGMIHVAKRTLEDHGSFEEG